MIRLILIFSSILSCFVRAEGKVDLALEYLATYDVDRFSDIIGKNLDDFADNERVKDALFAYSYGSKNARLAEVYDRYYEYPASFDLTSVTFNFCSNDVGKSSEFYEYVLLKLIDENIYSKDNLANLITDCLSTSLNYGFIRSAILLNQFIKENQDFAYLAPKLRTLVLDKEESLERIKVLYLRFESDLSSRIVK